MGPRILIASGSARADSFALPPRTDVVKLPCIEKVGDGIYAAKRLGLPLEMVKRVREGLIRTTVESFQPDLFLVDHAPAGADGELGACLRYMAERPDRPVLFLGLRDIIDSCKKVSAEWTRLGAWEHVKGTYDRVLVYGDPSILTTAEELGLPEMLAGRIRFTGYVAPRPPLVARGGKQGRVVVMLGGGADGKETAEAFVKALKLLGHPLVSPPVLLLGPFFPTEEAEAIFDLARASAVSIEVRRFDPDVRALLETSSKLVAMGGYNSVMEMLSLKRPTLLVPRSWPREEQLIRAERLTERVPFIHLAYQNADLPERMVEFLRGGTPAGSETAAKGPDLLGLDAIAEEVEVALKARLRGKAQHASRRA
jgi:predicted glycosyltransferase